MSARFDMNMLYFDRQVFEAQTTSYLNGTVATTEESGQTMNAQQIHTFSVDQNTKTVQFDILPLDDLDNFGGKDFTREDAMEMARRIEKGHISYNFSGITPKYDVRLLQVRETGNTATFVEKKDTKSNDPLKTEPSRSIIITLLVIAGLSVLGFAVWLMTRSNQQFAQFPQFGGMGMGGGMMFGQPGAMSPQGPMGPMSPHLGGSMKGHPLSPQPSFGAGQTPGMMGGAPMGGGQGWNALRNTFGAVNAFGTSGGLYGVGNPQGAEGFQNPSFMQQQQKGGAPGAFSPRFYGGGQAMP